MDAFDDINIDIENIRTETHRHEEDTGQMDNQISDEIRFTDEQAEKSQKEKRQDLPRVEDSGQMDTNSQMITFISNGEMKTSPREKTQNKSGSLSRINSVSRTMTEDRRLPSGFDQAEEFVDDSFENTFEGSRGGSLESKRKSEFRTEVIDEEEEEEDVEKKPSLSIRNTIDIYNLGKKVEETNTLFAEEVQKAKQKEKYLENRLLKLKFENKQEQLEKENIKLKLQVESMSEELIQTQAELENLINRIEREEEEMRFIKDKNERVEKEKEELKRMLKSKADAEDLEK